MDNTKKKQAGVVALSVAREAAEETSKNWIEQLPTAVLIVVVAIFVGIDTVNPVDLPLFIDEFLVAGPALLAAKELFRRWKERQAVLKALKDFGDSADVDSSGQASEIIDLQTAQQTATEKKRLEK